MNDERDEIQKYFDELPTRGVSYYFQSDWDSLVFWRPMNWRNFTFIHFYVETNNYRTRLELSIALMGFHFNLDWWRVPLKD